MIADTLRRAGPFDTDGAQTAFPFAFKVFAEEDLLVTSTSAGVATELVLNTGYTVSLNADQDSNPGGNVVISPALDGPTITITSALPIEQPTVFTNSGGFYPRVLNDALDRLTILAGQQAEQLSRAAVVPLDPADLIGKFARIGADGSVTFDSVTVLADTAEEATVSAILAGLLGDYISARRAADAAVPVVLTSSALVTPDFGEGVNFDLTLGHDAVLGNPANMRLGQSGVILIAQDATGGRELTYANKWKFPGGPEFLSTAPGAVDALAYIVLRSNFILCGLRKAYTS